MDTATNPGESDHRGIEPVRRVMLVSADLSLGMMLRKMIEDEWNLSCVETCAGAIASLADVDACMIDSWFPGGLSLMVRAHRESIRTPIVWLGTNSELTPESIRQGGAIDCLPLDIVDGPLLKRTLAYACGRAGSEIPREEKAITREPGESPRDVFSDFRDPIFLCDDNCRVMYANIAAGRLLGADPLRLVGNSYPELMPHAEGLCEIQTRIDGVLHILEVQVSQTVWYGDSVRLVSLRDVTRRHQMEDRLRRAYRALDSAMNGVIIVDTSAADWPLVYVNPAYERLTGYPGEEVLGQPCRMLLEPEENPDREKVSEAISLGASCHITARNQRRDGSNFWCEMNLAPVRNESSQITHYVAIFNDVTDQVTARERLEWQSRHHPLCGLLNQVGLHCKIDSTLEAARARAETLYAFWINIDDFHEINDEFGHEAGDMVIVEVARRLRNHFGLQSLLSRIGGDDFIAVVPGLSGDDEAGQLAGALRTSFAKPIELSGLSIRLTFCIGICHDGPGIRNGAELISHADIAMHHAKRTSPNTISLFSTEMADRVRSSATARDDLQRGIEQREFIVHYQPQVDAITGRLVGSEALVRWNHPTRGMLLPDQFLPAAELTGQVGYIDHQVMEIACRDTANMHSRGFSHLNVSVNVSTHEFQSPEFIAHVRSALRAAALPGEFLQIEIGESAIPDDTEHAIPKLEMLRRLGVKVVMVNFGRGALALRHLLEFPLDKVKMDRSIIRDIISDSRVAAVARSVVSMFQNLQIQVVADAVESDAQRSFLRRMNVDVMQGHLIAKPMAMEAFMEWCAHHQAENTATTEAPDSGGENRAILLVDDEPNILRALGRVLRRDGYRIHMARSAREAFEILAANPVHLIISDQRMPGMCGTEFLAQVKDLYPETIRMVLSGYTDLKSVTDAINQGAIYRFLTKPWSDDALRDDVRKVFMGRFRYMEDPSAMI